jgi:hypothetical protein
LKAKFLQQYYAYLIYEQVSALCLYERAVTVEKYENKIQIGFVPGNAYKSVLESFKLTLLFIGIEF